MSVCFTASNTTSRSELEFKKLIISSHLWLKWETCFESLRQLNKRQLTSKDLASPFFPQAPFTDLVDVYRTGFVPIEQCEQRERICRVQVQRLEIQL